MYESGHSPSVDELRRALRSLELAVADHEERLSEGGGSEAAAFALRQHLQLMREEVERLKALLAAR
jgi:hypothetical protein